MITSSFWRILKTKIGTKISLSTTFHPKTNRYLKRAIQILNNMLHAWVMDIED